MKQLKNYTIVDFYQHYIDDIEKQTVYDIDYTLYRKILVDYFQYIRDEVIERSREFKFPCRLGSIAIVKHKPKYLNGKSLCIDYKATKEIGKLIFHLNEHSDGYKYRIHWNKKDSNALNKSKYQLKLTRYNKRHLAQIIKNKEHDYVEI